jgi:hypothetical protein
MNISELSECYNPEKLISDTIVEWLPFRWSQEPPSEEAIPQEEPKKAPGIGAPWGLGLWHSIGDLTNKHGGIIGYYMM